MSVLIAAELYYIHVEHHRSFIPSALVSLQEEKKTQGNHLAVHTLTQSLSLSLSLSLSHSPCSPHLSSVCPPHLTILSHLGCQWEQWSVHLGHGDSQQEADAVGQPGSTILRNDGKCEFKLRFHGKIKTIVCVYKTYYLQTTCTLTVHVYEHVGSLFLLFCACVFIVILYIIIHVYTWHCIIHV